MMRVTADECLRMWGKVQEMAISQPVTITSNGRDRMVLMSTEEYLRLKRRDRQVMTLADFLDEDIEAIKKVQPSPESAAFNLEMKE